MTSFFARPILEDQQFKQIPGSILTLSGQTRIATLSGLTLANGSGGTIAINASGASFGNVMTYDGTQIRLMPPTGSGGTSIYTCASPTTCTVGGLVAGTAISGCSISKILQDILVPTLYPTLAPPFTSLSISPPSLLYEVGTGLTITSTICFNQGLVNPVYCGGPSTRTGVGTCYAFATFNSCTFWSGITCSYPNAGVIGFGSNSFSGIVAYAAGQYPKNSVGATGWTGCCSASIMTTNVVSPQGILPWFYGKSVSAPVAGQTLISTGGKCVGMSNNAIYVNNFNASNEYVWLAIPITGGTSKTCWQGANNPSNNGVIPGALFPTVTCVSIASPTGLWGVPLTPIPSPASYRFYISSYPTSINYGMTFCN